MFLIISAYRSNRHNSYNARQTTKLLRHLDTLKGVDQYTMCLGVYQGRKEISVMVDCGRNIETARTVLWLATTMFDQECGLLLSATKDKAMFVTGRTRLLDEPWAFDVCISEGHTPQGDYTDLLDGSYITLKEHNVI